MYVTMPKSLYSAGLVLLCADPRHRVSLDCCELDG